MSETEDLERLRRRATALERRVDQVERLLRGTGVAVAVVALVAGLLLPYLSEKKGDETISLLSYVFAVREDSDNGGPFSGEAGLVFVALLLLAVFAVVAVIVAFICVNPPTGRTRTVVRILAGIFAAGCLASWLMVLVLAGHFEKVSAFSPATLSLTIGAAVTVLLTRTEPSTTY
jgi:hypothetical protein